MATCAHRVQSACARRGRARGGVRGRFGACAGARATYAACPLTSVPEVTVCIRRRKYIHPHELTQITHPRELLCSVPLFRSLGCISRDRFAVESLTGLLLALASTRARHFHPTPPPPAVRAAATNIEATLVGTPVNWTGAPKTSSHMNWPKSHTYTNCFAGVRIYISRLEFARRIERRVIEGKLQEYPRRSDKIRESPRNSEKIREGPEKSRKIRKVRKTRMEEKNTHIDGELKNSALFQRENSENSRGSPE